MNASNRIEEIFHEVVGHAAAERCAALERLCGTDTTIRREVEALLRADADSASVPVPSLTGAEKLDPETWTAPATPISEQPGETIGRYKLLERIGEGGFGEVWVAEQKEPVRRRVALKIIKAGMDTREVLTRFEAERQVLALLDHPNIAKVFDAGATEAGRPYFVMEHVAGMPISEYCDSAKLRIRERLGLFTQICQAVQHAHTKGIIHRDLKPSNILVTLNDGRAVPKVIDFGIAKVTIDRLTDRTLYTQLGRLMGTPEYMAPEQAGTGGLDVDTRADIYSLGVILYQLLTGTLPFDAKMLRGAGFDGMVKLIRELEPPKPSTRLSTLATEKVNRQDGETPEEIGKRHGVAFADLRRELRGDLDWIVMKCLDKERSRRYETANSLALEIGRHLAGEPVHAAPPSAGYKLRKFIRRHRTAFVASCGIVAALVAGLLATTFALLQANAARRAEVEQGLIADRERSAAIAARDEARQAEQRAVEQADAAQQAREAEATARVNAEEEAANARAVTEFLQRMLGSVDPSTRPGEPAPKDRSGTPSLPGFLEAYAKPAASAQDVTVLEMLRRAIPQIESAAQGRPLVEATLRETIGRTLDGMGVPDVGPQLQRAVDLYTQMHGAEHPVTLRARVRLHTGFWSEPGERKDLQPLVPVLERVLGPEDPDTLRARLYAYLATADWPEDAIAPLRRLAEAIERVLGPADRVTLHARCELADALSKIGAYEEAERMARQALSTARERLGRDHPSTLAALRTLAPILADAGRIDEAVDVLREAVAEHLRVLGNDNWNTKDLQTVFGFHLAILERWPEVLSVGSAFEDRDLGVASVCDVFFARVRVDLFAMMGEVAQASALLDEIITSTIALDEAAAPDEERQLRNLAGEIVKPHMRPVAACLIDRFAALHDQDLRERAPDDPRRIDGVALLASLYVAAGRHIEARAVLYQALQEAAERRGLADEVVRSLFDWLVGAMEVRAVTAEDVELVALFLERAQRELAGDPGKLEGYFASAAWCLSRTCEQIEVVLDWARTAHRLAVETHGPESEKTWEGMNMLAVALLRAGRAGEAVELQARAVELAGRLPSQTVEARAECRARYGLMLAAAGRPAEARTHLLVSCRVLRRVNRDLSYAEWRRRREYFDTLADLLEREGNAAEAARWRGLVSPGEL